MKFAFVPLEGARSEHVAVHIKLKPATLSWNTHRRTHFHSSDFGNTINFQVGRIPFKVDFMVFKLIKQSKNQLSSKDVDGESGEAKQYV